LSASANKKNVTIIELLLYSKVKISRAFFHCFWPFSDLPIFFNIFCWNDVPCFQSPYLFLLIISLYI
jgi:hypothetical protein